jgi:Peptidase A4 family
LNSKPLAALALGAALTVAPVHTSDHHVTNTVDIPAPAVLSASAYSAVSAYGGRTLVQARVNTAVTACQLKLLSKQSFAVIYATNQRYCHVNFYAYVTVAANPTPVYRTLAFEVIGRNAWDQFSRGMVYLNVAPKGSNYHMPPPPVVNTDPAPPPVVKAVRPKPPAGSSSPGNPGLTTFSGTSNNWSGYEVLGNGLTSVHGTFTVPELDNDETCTSEESQWVGIDGGTAIDDNNLIQAGVMETPYDAFGDCNAPSYYYVQPWWEILPATATDIDSFTAQAGDSISVSIWQDSPGSDYWTISVVDNTNGGSFQTTQYYTGPQATAEWITESMTDNANCGGQCTETSYSPAVTYSGLGYDASTSPYDIEQMTMTQDGTDVSTPTWDGTLGQLLSQGFTTSYTGY